MLSDTCPSAGEWLDAAVVIFKIHDKQRGYQSGSVQHGAKGGTCRLPAVLGHGGISGGSEQPGEVLGVGAAFRYQAVRKCLNILKTEQPVVTLHVKAGWLDGQMERETMRLRSGQE